jgi:N-acetylglucosamine-6-sulfatase
MRPDSRITGRRLATPVTLAVLALLGACSAGGSAAIDCARAPARADARPNIVVVLTDDQTVEQVRVMPTVIDRLADVGTVLTNSVVNYSNCCPSRATLLTGQHASHHGVTWNDGPTGGFAAFKHQETALPVALHDAGYETVMIGKYLNRYGARDPEDRYVPPGWTDFKGLVFPAEAVYQSPAFYENGRLVEHRGEYTTTVITDHALDAIDRLSVGTAPFFMLLGHVAPHGVGGIPLDEVLPGALEDQLLQRFPDFINPPVPEPRYIGRFVNETLPHDAAFNERDQDDKPAALQRQLLDGAQLAVMTHNYRAELSSLLSVDDSIGAVLDRLEQRCVLDDTIIVYTSDNGFFHGEHRFPAGKYFAYEPSIRVPLVVSGPGVPRSVQPSLVSNVDLAPTIAEWAGAQLLRASDGRSLVPLFERPDEPWRRAVYVEGHAPPGINRPTFDGVHTGASVYLEYDDGSAELYDMVADPGQLENLVDDPSTAELLEAHRSLLSELRSCAGSACARVGADVPLAPSPPVAWLTRED